MNKKLYVGQVPFSTTDEELKEAFAPFGAVESCKIIIDRATNRSKGFGFVEMATEEDAKKAIAEMNGREFQGRNMVVTEARPPEERKPFQGRSGGPGGGGGGGGRDFRPPSTSRPYRVHQENFLGGGKEANGNSNKPTNSNRRERFEKGRERDKQRFHRD